jgi:hypothetical protein
MARDKALLDDGVANETPNQLNDVKKLQVMYGYDVRQEVIYHFEALDAKI